MCRAVAPHMREPAKEERAQGLEVFRKIVNVSSISGTMGNAGQANYSSGKSGVIGLTKTLAKERGQFKNQRQRPWLFGFIENRLTRSRRRPTRWEIDGQTVQLGSRPDASSPPTSSRWARPGRALPGRRRHLPALHPVANYITGQVLGITGGQWGGTIS